ncbi:cytochrome P450 [Actinoplanes sp. NPDC051861]|uniref:cytochrome P450 n=1 Tax=Actinoplanes sp. NPDC051861 TaxID=3155170 RepID=UPI0034224D7E
MAVTTDPGALVGLRHDERTRALFEYFEARAPERAGPSRQPGVFEVFGYDEAVQVLNDHGTYSNDFSGLIPADQAQLALVARGNLAGTDPPRHNLLRALVNQAFTPRIINKLEPWIAGLAKDLAERALEGGDADIVRDVASPLSASVIAELFAVPREDQRMFWGWSDQLLGARPDGALGVPDETAVKRRAALVREAGGYLLGHISRLRKNPGDDLTSALTRADVDGQALSDEEIMGVIGMFLIAGHLPTSLLIGNTVMCLDEHPDAAFDESAIDEVLRWRPPLIRDQRITTTEAKLGEHVVPARTMVVVWVAAANRDPRHFADPARFDAGRRPNRHLTMGRGIHYCIGAPLARLETGVMVRTLLERCAAIEIDRDGVEFHRSIGMLGPVKLPARLTAR